MAAFPGRLLARQLGTPAWRRAFSTTPQRLENYGFIGLGAMGYQMAKNLQSKLTPSDTIHLFDINREAMTRLSEEMRSAQVGGATVELADSEGDAAKDADVVVTALPGPAQVKAVYESIRSALPAEAIPSRPPRQRVFIDCSTIDPATSREAAASIRSAATETEKMAFVDAPMSGGVVGATAGTLTFMVGGGEEALALAEPTLLRMGSRVLHCGAQGSGVVAKLANNYVLATSNVATAEAMLLGVRSGLDPKVLAGVINASTGRCWPSEVNNPVPGVVEGSPASRDYQGGFKVALMLKDLKLANAAAVDADVYLPTMAATTKAYERAGQAEDFADRDFSVVYKHMGTMRTPSRHRAAMEARRKLKRMEKNRGHKAAGKAKSPVEGIERD